MRALDEGADIFQVVNAQRGVYTAGGRRFTREGTTRRGFARRRLGRGTPRLTPDQIFADATSRGHALELLQRNGYLLGLMARPSRALGVPGGGSDVRRLLMDAPTAEAVSTVLAAELRRITGREIRVDLRGSAETAREHAEGVLRVAERYPDVAINEVVTDRLLLAYAEWDNGRLIFSDRYSSEARRGRYLSELAGDGQADWHPFDSPVGMAVHEMGHALDVGTLGRGSRDQFDELVQRHGGPSGTRQVSGYAETNTDEFIAEAFADAMMNGPGATPLSRAVLDVLDAEYARMVPGPGAAAAPAVPVPERGVLTPAEFETRASRARTGFAVEDVPPVRVEVDASAGSMTSRWRAGEVTGATRRVPGAAAAVTRYLRAPAFTNRQLRGESPRMVAQREQLEQFGMAPTAEQLAKDAATAQRHIASLDALMAQSPLPRDVVVWRGARSVARDMPDPAVGYEWTDAGFVSTAVRKEHAQDFTAGRDSVLMRVLAPEGTPALSLHGGEGELLLARGLRYRVVADHGRPNGGARLIDVEILPPARSAPVAVPDSVPRARITRASKSRTEKAAGYPDRYPVPAAKAPWTARYPGYDPPDYTARVVLDQDRTVRPGGWADPADPRATGRTFTSHEGPVVLDESGRPMNPFGRTGVQGRGLLGKWGQNPAADPIITRYNPDTGRLEMAVIRRGDTDEWAIPGGMVDDGEQALSAAAREFLEETGADLDMSGARTVYRGYVDDPRNTDNAWMETTVVHRHLTPEEAARVRFGDAGVSSGEIRAVRWEPVTPEFAARMYASHGTFVREALKGMPRRQAPVKAAKAAAKKAPAKKAATASARSFDQRVGAAAQGDDVMRAAPSGMGVDPGSARGMTAAQIQAVREQRGMAGARRINGQLRSGKLDAQTRADVQEIDAAMAASRLTADVVVHRGMRDGGLVFGDRVGQDLTGAIWTEAGYLSTSQRASFATNWAEGGLGTGPSRSAPLPNANPVAMRILVPRGTGAIQPTDVELLLDRGLRLRVVTDRGVVGGVRVLDVEVIPATPGKAAAKKATKAAPTKAAAKAAPRKAAAPDLTGARGLSDVPAVRVVQIENRIRQAYGELPKAPGGWVGMADLRERLIGLDHTRAEFDAAIRRLSRDSDWRVTPVANRRSLTERDRAAVVRIGEDETNMVAFTEGRTVQLRPLPATPAKAAKATKAAPVKKAAKVAAPPAPQRMSLAALRTELERSGVTVPPRLAKATLVDEVTALRGGATPAQVSARLNPPTGARPVPIQTLFDADDATIEAALRDVYEGQFGPYTTKVRVHIRREGTRTDKRGRVSRVAADIGVDGEIFDATGRKIGYFGRRISDVDLHYADGVVRREIWADHATVQLEPRFQGKGFGGPFNQRAIEWYRASGVHGISLSDHNGYVWASQGFGFAQGTVPEHTITALRSLIGDLRAGRTKDQFGVAIPRALRQASDLDAQLVIAEDVLRRATTLQPGAPGYPTAREMSQMGRTAQRGKTSTWLGKFFMFENGSTSEMVLNPNQGVIISQ